MGFRVVLLLLLALLAPGAWAASASGDFVATGGLSLPEGTQQEMKARGAYFPAYEQGFAEVTLRAATLRVHRYEKDFVVARLDDEQSASFEKENRTATYTLTDVTVTLAPGGDHRGWLGLYPPQAGSPLSATSAGQLTVAAQALTRLGEGASTHNEAEAPAPQTQGYDWQVQEPLLLVTMEGEARLRGRGMMKLQGPDLLFESRENSTPWSTGWEAQDQGPAGIPPIPGSPAGTVTARWFFLEYGDAEVTLASREAFQLAAETLEASWQGPASFRPVTGSMTSTDVTYAAAGQRVRVAGDLTASVEPHVEGGEVRLRLRLSGDLSETTLAPSQGTRVPLGTRPGGWTLLLLGLAAAGLLLAALLAVRRRRARRAPPPPPPPAKPVPLAPLGVRALLDEASYLGAMGQIEEALAHYARAAELDPDGDADLQAAVLLLQSGGEVGRAEALAVKAFRRSPILVLEALYDVSGTFEPLRGRPGFEAALAAAKSELGEA